MISFAQKDILRLQVSVENLAIVHVLDREGYLREPFEYLVLGEVIPRAGGLVLVLSVFDALRDVSTFAILHDDTEDTLARAVDFSETRDVRMVENLEDARLSQRRLLLIFVHFGDFYLLDDSVGAIATALDKVSLAVCTLTNSLNTLIRLGRLFLFAT